MLNTLLRPFEMSGGPALGWNNATELVVPLKRRHFLQYRNWATDKPKYGVADLSL